MLTHPDYKDILAAFAARGVEYLVVGGYAVAFHGHPRFTKDLDLWVANTPANLAKVRAALVDFGAPGSMLEQLESATPEDVLWMGHPPVRIDIVKGVPGGDFARAYAEREVSSWDGVPIAIIGRAQLVAIKRASGRPQDLLDAELIQQRGSDAE